MNDQEKSLALRDLEEIEPLIAVLRKELKKPYTDPDYVAEKLRLIRHWTTMIERLAGVAA